jgi:hypothetical protein
VLERHRYRVGLASGRSARAYLNSLIPAEVTSARGE